MINNGSIYNSSIGLSDIQKYLKDGWEDITDKFTKHSSVSSIINFVVRYNQALGMISPSIAVRGNFRRDSGQILQPIFTVDPDYTASLNQVWGLYWEVGATRADFGASVRIENGVMSVLFLGDMNVEYLEFQGVNFGYINKL